MSCNCKGGSSVNTSVLRRRRTTSCKAARNSPWFFEPVTWRPKTVSRYLVKRSSNSVWVNRLVPSEAGQKVR